MIWLGVTGQKRSWIEQIDGYASIINSLYKKYPSLTIIFDGWTSPKNPTQSDSKSILEDLEIIQKIRDRAPQDLNFIITAGAKMDNKIACARLTDFFIANYMTGSMIISRIAKKPGVGHMSNISEYMTGMHHHHHISRVDKKYVSDLDEDTGIRADFISYHIDWQHVYEKLIEVMDSFSVKKIEG